MAVAMKRFFGTIVLAVACAALLTGSEASFALDDGLALTPPMGWNSWNKFGCNINEQLVKEIADAMVSSGMKDAGYQYIVIDDCWQVSRDEEGNIVADAQRFPSGIKALADYVHSKGLKFGLYSDAGTGTCQRRPGSRGYEFQDARTYANWGVDYLKYDWCNTSTQNAPASYNIMRDALKKAGRPIVFSICEWGTNKPWEWGAKAGHLWRTTRDISDRWDNTQQRRFGLGVVNILDLQAGLEQYAGPGHWNDPDMLEVGNGGMTDTEYRSHFSLWCLLASPLMSGNDLREMTPETIAILTNKEVIAINQDTLGTQGKRIRDDGDLEVWTKPLADGSIAAILLNRSAAESKMSLTCEDLGLPAGTTFTVRDLWAHKDIGRSTGSYSASVASHGVAMVKVKAQK
jgi:alpha-galactosidase